MARTFNTKDLPETMAGRMAAMLKDAMIERNLTLTEVGRRMGISGSALSRMLNGDSFTLKTLERIAAAIGIQVEFMISDNSEQNYQI